MRCQQRGFTLIELMLVILLMGLLASVPMLMIGNDGPRQRIEQTARQLLAHLSQAREQAVLAGQELGLLLESDQYGFAQLIIEKPDDTSPQADEPPSGEPGSSLSWYWQSLQTHNLPGGITLELSLDGLLPELGESASEPDDAVSPQVFIFSSGELTPFTLRIYHTDSDQDRATITGSESGQLTLAEAADE